MQPCVFIPRRLSGPAALLSPQHCVCTTRQIWMAARPDRGSRRLIERSKLGFHFSLPLLVRGLVAGIQHSRRSWPDRGYWWDRLPDDRVSLDVLFNIILASYNDAITQNSARSEDWDLISRYLIRDRQSHEAIINYWTLPDEVEPANCFPITPLLRKVMGPG